MNRSLLSAAAALLAMSVTAGAQDAKGGIFPPTEVDYVKIDIAINKGIAFLKGRNSDHLKRFDHVKRQMQHTELVLYTYVHAGVPESDPAFKELFDDMMKRDLEATYCVALQAMVLEDVERVKYQRRIQRCAQFLVDNQSADGFWGYGAPSIFVEDIPSEAPARKDVESFGGKAGVRNFEKLPPGAGVKVKPVVKNKLKVEKKRDGDANDNSNTQYAALGLRACHDAGIILPEKVVDAAMKWWRDSQKNGKDPAEELVEGGVMGPDVPGVRSGSGQTVAGPSIVKKAAPPNGWSYKNGDHEAYGSMSAGATGSLAILDYIKDNDGGKKRSWKTDKDVHEGLVWLAKNFSVTYNPGPYEHAKGADGVNSQHQYYYYLYALERAGMLYGTEMMGTHKWFPEGAKVLLDKQKPDGQWGGGVRDTCFAILFLKRATRPLDVATGGKNH